MSLFYFLASLLLIAIVYFLTSFAWFSIVLLLIIMVYGSYYCYYHKINLQRIFMAGLLFSFAWIIFTSPTNYVIAQPQTINVTVVANKASYYLVNYHQTKYLLLKKYFVKQLPVLISAEVDDQLTLVGTTQPITTPANFYDFDFQSYLASMNVNQALVLKPNSTVTVTTELTIRSKIMHYVDHSPELIKNYTNLLVWQKNDHSSLVQTFAQWGIIAILVVSGLHINIFFSCLAKILFFIKNKTTRTVIVVLMLLFYLYLLSFPVSGMRALLALIINYYWHRQKKSANALTTFTITLYLSLLVNPLVFYQLGWQLSFGINLAIILVKARLTKYQKHWQTIFLFLIIFLLSLPIQLMLNHSIPLFSIFYQIFFTPVIIGYDCLLMVNLLIGWLVDINFLVLWCLQILDRFISVLTKVNLNIPGFQPEIWMLQLFFLIMFFAYFWWQYGRWKLIFNLIINCSLILAMWINNYNGNYYEISMINVGNAMSILVTSPNQQQAILIDAGVEGQNHNSNIIYHYLSAKGISTLDAVFLTHKDSDHTNNFDYLNHHLTIKNLFHNENIQPNYYLSTFGMITNLSYDIAPLVKNEPENNRCLVLLFQFFNFKFLITGDIEAKTEDLLLAKNLVPQIDILQVAHHGSKTSSSEPFLLQAQPKTAIISGHYQKLRHFPDPQVVNRLQMLNINTYWTGKNKTIIIRVAPKDYQILTLQ